MPAIVEGYANKTADTGKNLGKLIDDAGQEGVEWGQRGARAGSRLFDSWWWPFLLALTLLLLLCCCLYLCLCMARRRKYAAGPPGRDKGASATFRLPLTGYVDGDPQPPVTVTVLGRGKSGGGGVSRGGGTVGAAGSWYNLDRRGDRSREDAGHWFCEKGSLGTRQPHQGLLYSEFEPETMPSLPSFGPTSIPPRTFGRDMAAADRGGGGGGSSGGGGGGEGKSGSVVLMPQIPAVTLSWGGGQKV